MAVPTVVSQAEWQAARAELLAKEKEATRARDTALALISRAPYDEIRAFKQRMGWTVPWFSSIEEVSR
jgi:predicted dithiol-disulfide oxidoreductase (DUF899 family)